MRIRRILTIGFLCAASLARGAAERLDGIAAVVGDSVITASELDAYVLLRLNSLGLKPDSVDIESTQRQFLDELIDGKVLLVHAEKDTTITIRNDDVEQSVEARIAAILQQNNMTMADLEAEIRKAQGITLAKFRAQLRAATREQLLKQKVMQQYLSSVQISRKEVESFYREYRDSLPKAGKGVRLSKLTRKITTSDSVKQKAYERIRLIKERLSAGEDFVKLAQQFSEDPNASAGGDLGFIGKGTLNELVFEEKAFSLAPGRVSEIFETRLGFHIITVVARKEKKVHVRQILVKVEPPSAQLQRITGVLDSIRQYARTDSGFAAAVRRLSDDPQSKARGGDLGWISTYEVPASLRPIIDSMEVGQVTLPIKEEGAYSIYRIVGRAENRDYTLEDDWELIAEKAREIQAQKRLIGLVRKWREEVFVDVRLN